MHGSLERLARPADTGRACFVIRVRCQLVPGPAPSRRRGGMSPPESWSLDSRYVAAHAGLIAVINFQPRSRVLLRRVAAPPRTVRLCSAEFADAALSVRSHTRAEWRFHKQCRSVFRTGARRGARAGFLRCVPGQSGRVAQLTTGPRSPALWYGRWSHAPLLVAGWGVGWEGGIPRL